MLDAVSLSKSKVLILPITFRLDLLQAQNDDTMSPPSLQDEMPDAQPGYRPTQDLEVSFSHVQLYVDHVEDVSVYKELEETLNKFHVNAMDRSFMEQRQLWDTLLGKQSSKSNDFVSHNRDLIKQLMVGFGFRVTGYRFPEPDKNAANTKSLLVTSRDPSGVQIIVTARASNDSTDDYFHFDSTNLQEFYESHANRQGIAVLGFKVNDVALVRRRYEARHPNLFHSYKEYGQTKVLQVYAFYGSTPLAEGNEVSVKERDAGTMLRFVELDGNDGSWCLLPGLTQINAVYDSVSQAAYCDHWVSNVFSRTEFLSTLEDTLGFTPKVDFNAGVVAAGEAQIESTVTGNKSLFKTCNKLEALKNQSQVFLPINNALSNVGHVHGFLKEIGQGIQHLASRIDNLVEFVEQCNRMRELTGEGFTFLKIPRSYYGTLTWQYLVVETGISEDLARTIVGICQQNHITSLDSSVDLRLTKDELFGVLESGASTWSTPHRDSYHENRDAILAAILSSRYRNLYSLLRNHLSEATYMGIVRNEILVDVQGEDVLYQIFTSNILQRKPGEEAPFLEFIQRVCSECQSENECPVQIKPGCGGFGIRNFLTLFLSIEVSKAMHEASAAKLKGDNARYMFEQNRVDCFTNQLNDSNPILTEISDAMTEEGRCQLLMDAAILQNDTSTAAHWREQMEKASQRKQAGNAKLMACSAQYESMMRSIRESFKK